MVVMVLLVAVVVVVAVIVSLLGRKTYSTVREK